MVENRFAHILNHDNNIWLQFRWQLQPLHLVVEAVGHFCKIIGGHFSEEAINKQIHHTKCHNGNGHNQIVWRIAGNAVAVKLLRIKQKDENRFY